MANNRRMITGLGVLSVLLCSGIHCGAAPGTDGIIRVSEKDEVMEKGKFEPEWESLSQYEVPEWFRDAKFGIWAHWGPQCVEGSGDWMARGLYEEGSDAYKYHLANYGHPSEFGFKDVLPLFKAEKWNADSLVALYKGIGAKYFVALGNHHDNFDLWDSKYQPWNSKNIGPERDILKEWSDAARRHGLPFGVSLHADHAWTWYETAQRYDRKGEKKGEPYDGNLTAADGKGKWWEGMDPQQLYAQDHPLSKGSWAGMLDGQWDWENGAALPSAEFCTNFYNRTLDVINRYNPDLLYFDTTGVPFYPVSDAGLKIAAHFYNHSSAANNGRNRAVMLGKILNDEQKKSLVWDVERGAPNEIIPLPWQCCSCIGNWHYNTSYYEQNRYKSANTVICLLADIVSKNGNLLLSIPLRGDGTFDDKERVVIEDIGRWMRVNGEAIYGTRPWKRFGEGPVAESAIPLNAQGFNEGSYSEMSSREIRFTTKGKNLYALCLAWPEDDVVRIKSLAGENVRKVELLGHGMVKFSKKGDGLEVSLPADVSSRTVPVLKITGR